MVGFISGLADQLGNIVDERRAVSAYEPLLNAVYGGAPQQQSGGFLSNLLGMGQGATPGMTGAPAAQMAPSAGAPAGSAPAMPASGMAQGMGSGAPQIDRAAVLGLLQRPETREQGVALLMNGGRMPPSEIALRQQRFEADQAWKEKEFAADQAHRNRMYSLQASSASNRPPALETFYNPETGQNEVRQWNGGGWTTVGPAAQTTSSLGTPASRADVAAQYGLEPGTPAYQSFVLTGKMPREDQSSLTATDRKAILEADEMVMAAEGVVPLLDKALELNGKAFSGPTASMRATAGNNLPDWMVPGTPDQAQATTELDNVVTTQALNQMKAIFGAAPTEGERQILLQIAGSSSLPPKVREGIYTRAKEAVNRRLAFYRQRAQSMRGSDYYKPSTTAPTAGGAAAPDPLGLR